MYATSISARAPAARSLAAVWTELPSTYFTVAPVAFSNAVAWHFLELSTNVPPKAATTRSSARAGRARTAMNAAASRGARRIIMMAVLRERGMARLFGSRSKDVDIVRVRALKRPGFGRLDPTVAGPRGTPDAA